MVMMVETLETLEIPPVAALAEFPLQSPLVLALFFVVLVFLRCPPEEASGSPLYRGFRSTVKESSELDD
jgi:hypothetical protein